MIKFVGLLLVLFPSVVFAADLDVGSRFNIYGNLFGWSIYDNIYNIIVGTGIWVIPFLFMIYQVMASRDEGNKYDPVSAQIALEWRVIPAILLLFIFFVPTVSANKIDMIYNDGAKSLKSGDTGTTFDKFDVNIPATVKVPAGWYAILAASSGFSNALKSILPTGAQARAVLYELNQVTIDDPDVQRSLDEFEAQCARPARLQFNQIMTTYKNGGLAKKFTKMYNDNAKIVAARWKLKTWARGDHQSFTALTYPGNDFFVKYLYQPKGSAVKLCVEDPLDATKNQDPKAAGTVCIPRTSEGPKQECDAKWKTLRTALEKNYMKSKTIKYTTNDTDDFIYGNMTTGNFTGAEKSIGDAKGGWGTLDGFAQSLIETRAAVKLNFAAWWAKFFNSVLRFYLPIMLGLINLFFIALLPIMMVFGSYSHKSIIPLATTYFGVAFLPGIWHFAAWIDQVMLTTVYGNKGILSGLMSLETAVVDIISLSVYVVFTYLWIGFLKEMGGVATHAIRGAGTDGDPSSTYSANKTGRTIGAARQHMKERAERKRNKK